MGILDSLQDLKKETVTFQGFSSTKNSTTGRVSESWTTKGTIDVWFWKNNGRISESGKLIGTSTGQIAIDPNDPAYTFTVTDKDRFQLDSKNYYVTSADNIAIQDEVIIVDWDKREDQ